CKTQQLQTLVSDQNSCLLVAQGQNAQCFRWPACFKNQLRQQERAEWSLRSWFEYNWTSDGNRRSQFVRYQIQWEVKRRDRGDRPNGKSTHDPPAPFGSGNKIKRQVFTKNSDGLFCGGSEGQNSPIDLRPSRFRRLPGFKDHQSHERIGVLQNPLRNFLQDVFALEQREFSHFSESSHRRGNRAFKMTAVRHSSYADLAAVIR